MDQGQDGLSSSARERARVRELCRYFPATTYARELRSSAGHVDSGQSPPGPRLSSDPALTAFAQLSAIRLNCDRAFISLIDSQDQHVIAEATKSISLVDDMRHGPGDALSFGSMKLDLIAGVCAGTLKVLTSRDCSRNVHTDNIYADQSRYVINDFTREPLYRDRPYITGFPFMRFYADVPIRTESGYVIGSLSVVDSKPRAGLSEDDFAILVELASTIMRHLVLLRTNEEHDRAGRLLKGLSYFVQRDSPQLAARAGDLQSDEASAFPVPRPITTSGHGRPKGSVSRPDMSRNISYTSQSDTMTTTSSLGTDATSSNEENATVLSPPTTAALSQRNSYSIQKREPSTSSLSLSAENLSRKDGIDAFALSLQQTSKAKNVRDSFRNAAKILSQAMNLDGMVFLDASPGGASLHPEEDDQLEPLEGTTQSLSLTEASRERCFLPPVFEQDARHSSTKTTTEWRKRMSTRLGKFIRARSQQGSKTGQGRIFTLPEDIHQRLQNRYPRGHVFTFDEDENMPSSPPPKPPSPSNFTTVNKNAISDAQPLGEEGHALRHFFPGATSVLYLPLWDPHRLRWVAGSIGWISDLRRVFTHEDFAYYTAFGNSVMTEITRLELIATDQAKSDFISSISHELRSPLHGILGSAELLMGEAMDDGQKQTISMITKCGRSLLDTMEHILVYSKINAAAQDRQHHLNADMPDSHQAVKEGAFESHSSFDLSTLVEDTVESTVAGYNFTAALSEEAGGSGNELQYPRGILPNEPPPTVVLAIDGEPSWMMNSEAGAWRRILMNLLGNAFKYTTTGFIEVGLRTSRLRSHALSSGTQTTVTMTIKDTGRGISEEYIRNHLYTAFSQENALSPGAGLGLNIVRHLIISLNGKIDVHSEVGSGTSFVVSIPVVVETPPAESSTVSSIKLQTKDRTLCLLALDVYPELDTTPTGILSMRSRMAIAQKTAMTGQAQHWFGMKVVSAQTAAGITADVIVVEENKLHLLETRQGSEEGAYIPNAASVIVLCDGLASQAQHMRNRPKTIQYLAHPIGPHKFATALSQCFEARDAANTQFDTRSDTPRVSAPPDPGNLDRSESDETIKFDHTPTSSLTTAYANSYLQTPFSSAGTALQTKPHLLLVDDNVINLKILVAYMKKLSCTYETAINGLQAFEAYKATPRAFQFVFMDISMPVMDGFASTRAIRAFELDHHMQSSTIIALTGLGSSDAQREGHNSGMDLFLTKPVPMGRVKQIVEGKER